MNNVDFEEVSYPPRPKTTLSLEGSLLCERPGVPLGAGELDKFIDKDGRLVDEHQLRKAVFRGMICVCPYACTCLCDIVFVHILTCMLSS